MRYKLYEIWNDYNLLGNNSEKFGLNHAWSAASTLQSASISHQGLLGPEKCGSPQWPMNLTHRSSDWLCSGSKHTTRSHPVFLLKTRCRIILSSVVTYQWLTAKGQQINQNKKIVSIKINLLQLACHHRFNDLILTQTYNRWFHSLFVRYILYQQLALTSCISSTKKIKLSGELLALCWIGIIDFPPTSEINSGSDQTKCFRHNDKGITNTIINLKMNNILIIVQILKVKFIWNWKQAKKIPRFVPIISIIRVEVWSGIHIKSPFWSEYAWPSWRSVLSFFQECPENRQHWICRPV